MRVRAYAKMFFCVIPLTILIIVYTLSIHTSQVSFTNNLSEMKRLYLEQQIEIENRTLKYILQWTLPNTIPFVHMGVGQLGFIERNCAFTNCFVTSNRKLLGDYTKFDVIAFHGPEIVRRKKYSYLPQRRSQHQKFVFASIESSDYYPICFNWLDGYFNWTWTYKLNSDTVWGYILIRNSNDEIIGPKTEMHWLKLEEMKPVDDVYKDKLKTKSKAAAWFVSNCSPRSKRDVFVKRLQNELEKYDLTVDIYGKCGELQCAMEKNNECDDLVKKTYYFYLSLENSFSEDYVTEKILTALQNDAVPIVYGAANYTRFMPNGIYLNGRELGVQKLAAKMNELIQDNDKYLEYFKWKNHYSYHNSSEGPDSDYCRFCEMLNNEKLMKETTVYQNFRQWWNADPRRCSIN